MCHFLKKSIQLKSKLHYLFAHDKVVGSSYFFPTAKMSFILCCELLFVVFSIPFVFLRLWNSNGSKILQRPFPEYERTVRQERIRRYLILFTLQTTATQPKPELSLFSNISPLVLLQTRSARSCNRFQIRPRGCRLEFLLGLLRTDTN